jgi:hypothetical protein
MLTKGRLIAELDRISLNINKRHRTRSGIVNPRLNGDNYKEIDNCVPKVRKVVSEYIGYNLQKLIRNNSIHHGILARDDSEIDEFCEIAAIEFKAAWKNRLDQTGPNNGIDHGLYIDKYKIPFLEMIPELFPGCSSIVVYYDKFGTIAIASINKITKYGVPGKMKNAEGIYLDYHHWMVIGENWKLLDINKRHTLKEG